MKRRKKIFGVRARLIFCFYFINRKFYSNQHWHVDDFNRKIVAFHCLDFCISLHFFFVFTRFTSFLFSVCNEWSTVTWQLATIIYFKQTFPNCMNERKQSIVIGESKNENFKGNRCSRQEPKINCFNQDTLNWMRQNHPKKYVKNYFIYSRLSRVDSSAECIEWALDKRSKLFLNSSNIEEKKSTNTFFSMISLVRSDTHAYLHQMRTNFFFVCFFDSYLQLCSLFEHQMSQIAFKMQ